MWLFKVQCGSAGVQYGSVRVQCGSAIVARWLAVRQAPSVKQHTDKKEKKIFLIYKEIKRDRVQSHI